MVLVRVFTGSFLSDAIGSHNFVFIAYLEIYYNV